MMLCVMALTFTQTETALIYDAIELYARALHTLDSSQRGNFAPQPLNCNPSNPADIWKQGHLLLDELKKVCLFLPC